MSTGHLLKSVKQHPDVAKLGNDALEQGRIASFAVDLAHWLSGESIDSLGLLGRLILMVIHEELADIRELCRQRPRVAITAAAQITSELWPELQGHESATVLSSCPRDQRPLLELLRECSQFDVPELLRLAERLEATAESGSINVESAARTLMNGIPSATIHNCQAMIISLDK